MVYTLLIIPVIIFFYLKNTSTSICHICNKKFHTLKNIIHLFCPTHQIYIEKNIFLEFISTMSDPEKPEDSLFLYKMKEDLWIKNKIVTYTTEKYIEKGNQILTIVTLFIEAKNQKKIQSLFNKFIN